jgi:coiled-coil domain-containing protein 55
MKRYGLLGSASSLGGGKGRGRAGGRGRGPGRGSAVSAAFGGRSDSEDDGNTGEDPMSREAVNRRLVAEQAERERKVDKAQVTAVMEDPNVYEYDALYEVMTGKNKVKVEEAKNRAAEASTQKKKAPKYISSLMQQAKMREVEQDRVYERKLAKERQEAEKEFGKEEMKFVTSSYKKKLMEQRKWELQEQVEQEKEERAEEQMRRGGGMTGFYSNLLTKNIALGGSVDHATSAFTTGSKRHDKTVTYDQEQAKSLAQVQESNKEEPGFSQDGGKDSVTSHSLRSIEESLTSRKRPRSPRVEKPSVEEKATPFTTDEHERCRSTKEAEATKEAAKTKREGMIAAAKRRALERKTQQAAQQENF